MRKLLLAGIATLAMSGPAMADDAIVGFHMTQRTATACSQYGCVDLNDQELVFVYSEGTYDNQPIIWVAPIRLGQRIRWAVPVDAIEPHRLHCDFGATPDHRTKLTCDKDRVWSEKNPLAYMR